MLDLDNTIKIPISRFFRLSRLTTDSSSSRFPKSKIISKIFFLIRLEKIVAHGGSGIEAAKAIPFATVNYRSNSPSISETWARAIGPSSLAPFTPHCIERRISRYGYHSSVANSTPGTVAWIGSACAQAALIYLPPFPILSLRHTDLVPADILLSQPMLPNPLSRDQIAYRHRLPRITNDARPSLPPSPYTRFFFWPSSAPVTTFVGSRLIGLLDDERGYIVVAGNTGECIRSFRYGVHSDIVRRIK